MKCNVRELAQMSDQTCIIEGRLNYKKISNGGYLNQTVFKERWFRLVNNYLFYFKISELGTFDTKNPAGVFVMENSSVDMEHGHNIPFAFSISFIDESERRHLFAARTEDNVVQWVMKLRICSYEYLRNRLHVLQSKIFSITGNDPLLMVPRNDGAKLWAPGLPISVAPACSPSTSSFSCHLHVQGFTLERSRSDVQTHRRLHRYVEESASKTTESINNSQQNITDKKCVLERSKTSAMIQNKLNSLDSSIFDNRPAFSRAAPSPPIRKKLSPVTRRQEPNLETKQFTEQSKFLAVVGILDTMPVPPRRKISPKALNTNIEINVVDDIDNKETLISHTLDDDLIKFE